MCSDSGCPETLKYNCHLCVGWLELDQKKTVLLASAMQRYVVFVPTCLLVLSFVIEDKKVNKTCTEGLLLSDF